MPPRTWTNQLAVRAVGVMRSGNHVVIDWVRQQFAGLPVCFLNNLRHGDHDPFRSDRQVIVTGMPAPASLEALRSSKKRLLIYSYEDRRSLRDPDTFIRTVYDPGFEANRDSYLGDSERSVDLLIVRDPFNCFASRLKLLQERGPLGGLEQPQAIVKAWKALAREAIRVSRSGSPDRIVVRYNHWVGDRREREQLSRDLGGTFDDTSLTRTATFGGGSSFDEYKIGLTTLKAKWRKLFRIRTYGYVHHYWRRLRAPRPGAMKLHERWRHFSDDPTYLGMVLDEEVIHLSTELFGNVPGTHRLLK